MDFKEFVIGNWELVNKFQEKLKIKIEINPEHSGWVLSFDLLLVMQ